MSQYFEVASEAARAAGEVLERHFAALSGVRAKGPHDLVSEADLAAERAILAILRRRCPGHAIMA